MRTTTTQRKPFFAARFVKTASAFARWRILSGAVPWSTAIRVPLSSHASPSRKWRLRSAVRDARNHVVTRYPEPARWIGQPLPASVRDARRVSPDGVIMAEGPDGLTRAYATAPIGKHGLRVAVGIPTDYVFAAPRAARLHSYLVAGMTLLLATVLTFLFARALARPGSVMLSHDNLRSGMEIVSGYLELTERDVILSLLPFSFDYGLNQLLTAVAERLRPCAADADTVARFGGDEFAVLLETGSAEAAMRTAAAIQRALAAPVGLGGYEVVTSASIGIAVATAQTDGPEALLRSADAAMYRAKSRGPGGCEVYDRAMHALALARLRTETELRTALVRGEITPHYQPIVSLATGRITGVEALARWRHPERGWVLPGEFVGVAEESGAILELGRRVLLQACRDAGAWSRALACDVGVSVNLSVKQLAQADLVDQVRRALDDTGCDPARLRLEITESVLVENPEGAASTLSRLKELGLRVLMDDFGTGYSSLSALHRLPVDGLKVDRSFVAAMGRDGRAGELVASVVRLARGLGLEVVAEGIERPDQLAGLRALGCDAAQGFLFSPAVDAASLQRLLASNQSW